MANFPIDPGTGMPIVHVDEQQQMERYLAEVAMEDILLSGGTRSDKTGTLARYKEAAAREREYEAGTDISSERVFRPDVMDGSPKNSATED